MRPSLETTWLTPEQENFLTQVAKVLVNAICEGVEAFFDKSDLVGGSFDGQHVTIPTGSFRGDLGGMRDNIFGSILSNEVAGQIPSIQGLGATKFVGFDGPPIDVPVNGDVWQELAIGTAGVIPALWWDWGKSWHYDDPKGLSHAQVGPFGPPPVNVHVDLPGYDPDDQLGGGFISFQGGECDNRTLEQADAIRLKLGNGWNTIKRLNPLWHDILADFVAQWLSRGFINWRLADPDQPLGGLTTGQYDLQLAADGRTSWRTNLGPPGWYASGTLKKRGNAYPGMIDWQSVVEYFELPPSWDPLWHLLSAQIPFWKVMSRR
jgi:hypothetical protein